MTQYVLQYVNGALVGIDLGSGGYPFQAYNPGTNTGTLSNVMFFHSRESAEEYRKTFPEFEIKEFVFELK